MIPPIFSEVNDICWSKIASIEKLMEINVPIDKEESLV
jgi:hypothetical protein